jgi:hypothetical protein
MSGYFFQGGGPINVNDPVDPKPSGSKRMCMASDIVNLSGKLSPARASPPFKFSFNYIINSKLNVASK